MQKYYSIRVVKARDTAHAERKVKNQEFNESDLICDRVLNIEDLLDFAVTRFKKGVKHDSDN